MKPHKIYSDTIEGKALSQFYDAIKQDYVVKAALMPDAHAGYSLPIGAVVATQGVVVPAWVGYDIGCGMCAIPTTFDVDELRSNSDSIFSALYTTIPVGFHINNQAIDVKYKSQMTTQLREIFDKKGGNKAIGSLGSGNHFIEIGFDENNIVWIIIHSGSRGIGHGCATHYMKVASNSNKAKEGHYGFDVCSQNGKDYIIDQAFCLEFALKNRKEMMNRAVNVLKTFCTGSADWDNLINRNHNHADLRDGLWIHRKGATHAENGMMGVIPGNMRDGSFIVRGKGCEDSLWSSSHGAGRVMGRRQAKENVKFEQFKETMVGITAKVEESTLDESPMVYKDIFEVMDNQKDLVEVVALVKPLINVKG